LGLLLTAGIKYSVCTYSKRFQQRYDTPGLWVHSDEEDARFQPE